MANRSVYLVETITPEMIEEPDLTFVDDPTLAKLLGEGWEVSKTMTRKVKVAGKPVEAEMLLLKRFEDDRALMEAPRREVSRSEPMTGGGGDMIVTDEFGVERRVSTSEAFVRALADLGRGVANMGEHVGHLGAPGRHNIPGMQVISGEMISKAYDMGMMAGVRGVLRDRNPFPVNSPPHTKWLQGHADSNKLEKQGVTREQVDEAEKQGFDLAQQLGEGKDEVTCAHSHPVLKAAWLRGFVRGGGKVI